jgi:tetratricopeptide (TPR) repeat protein
MQKGRTVRRLRTLGTMATSMCWLALAATALALNGCTGMGFGGTPNVSQTATSEQQQQRLSDARAASDAGNYDQALSLFQQILAENPTITSAYLGIGDIYIVKQDYDRAEPAYARAARLEPRNFDAQYGHGLALQMLGRFVDAIRAYHRALTIDPENFNANLNIATTYLQMEQPEHAVTFAEKAVQANPQDGPARVNLGAAYERVGRNSDAVSQYEAAIELMEPSPEVMMNLINALAKDQRYHEAVNTAEFLVRVEPTAPAYERLGWGYFKLADYQKSLDAYRKAVELDPNHWPALNGVGVNAINTWLVSKKADDTSAKEARRALRRSLQINPDQPKVVTLLSNYNL